MFKKTDKVHDMGSAYRLGKKDGFLAGYRQSLKDLQKYFKKEFGYWKDRMKKRKNLR